MLGSILWFICCTKIRIDKSEAKDMTLKVQKANTYINDRMLSVIVFALFFAWLLAFPFEGQILYSITDSLSIEPDNMIFGAIALHFAGLLASGFIIKSARAAKKLMLATLVYCFLCSGAFLMRPSMLWGFALISGSFLAGGFVASWGFYLKCCTVKNERIKTTADGLIYSNIIMIALNMSAIHITPRIGLLFAMLVLIIAFLFALRLPGDDQKATLCSGAQPADNLPGVNKPLALLYLFVVVITINSGLMYQVFNPAFGHLEGLASWYWAVPYIAALFIMRNLPRRTNRTYILYVAITMIGFSFIAFMSLDRSAPSYLMVDTLMLGACGVYDLFWWSILGEMLDFDKNPAKILGVGLSANVLGVLMGGMIGNAIEAGNNNASLVALAVVCVSLSILPLLHKKLSALLKDHAYLTTLSEMSPREQSTALHCVAALSQLTGREREVAELLLKGKNYKTIASELHISDNTAKSHIKNIYSKLKIHNRTELIKVILEKSYS